MDRRDFLRMSAATAAAPLLGAAASGQAAEEPAGAAAVMFGVLPQVHLLGEDCLGIVWMTTVKATGRVTWSQDDWRTERTAVYGRDGLLDANSLFHKAVLDGVDLRKPLRYRIHSRRIGKFDVYGIGYAGEEVSYESHVNAPLPKDAPLTWAMLNDIHGQMKIYDRLVPLLAGVNAMCVFNGDVMEDLTYEAKFLREFMGPLSRVAQERHMPVYFQRGNHDTRGQLARNLRDYLALPGGRYWNAMTLDGVRFVFADTGEDKEDGHRAYAGVVDFDSYFAREVKWLRREVASEEWKNARARIAIQHIPPQLSKGGWSPGLKRLDALNEIWASANVTLMMGGHTHWWLWSDPWPERPYPLVVGGGPYLGNPENHDNATLTKCSLQGKTLSVKMLDQTGKTIMEKTLAV